MTCPIKSTLGRVCPRREILSQSIIFIYTEYPTRPLERAGYRESVRHEASTYHTRSLRQRQGWYLALRYKVRVRVVCPQPLWLVAGSGSGSDPS